MTIAWERPVDDWVEDLTWHRRMFSQSRFRWLDQDVTTVALRYTHGRLEFSTLTDLARLDDQLVELRTHILQLLAAVAEPLRVVRSEPVLDWSAALNVAGLTPQRASEILWWGDPPLRDRETRRVLAGIPWRTPLTEAWELLQLVGMYEAAADLLEDGVCDLAAELLATRPVGVVAAHSRSQIPSQLEMRIEDNLTHRGPVGDSRRRPHQGYPSIS